MLKNLDLFSRTYSFRFDQDLFYRTNFGGALSILFYLCSVGIVVALYFSFNYSNSPYFSVVTEGTLTPVQVGLQNIVASIRVKTNSLTIFNTTNPFFEIHFRHVRISEGLILQSNLSLTTCNKELFSGFPPALDDYNLTNSLCANMNSLILEGNLLSIRNNKPVSFVELGVGLCTNSSSKICHSRETIEQFIVKEKPVIQLLLTDNNLIEDSAKGFISQYEKYYENPLDYSSTSVSEIKYSLVKLSTSSSYSRSFPKLSSDLILSKKNRDQNSFLLSSIVLSASSDTFKVMVWSVFFTDFMSKSAGLVTIFYSVCSIINNRFATHRYLLDTLSKSFFYYPKDVSSVGEKNISEIKQKRSVIEDSKEAINTSKNAIQKMTLSSHKNLNSVENMTPNPPHSNTKEDYFSNFEKDTQKDKVSMMRIKNTSFLQHEVLGTKMMKNGLGTKINFIFKLVNYSHEDSTLGLIFHVFCSCLRKVFNEEVNYHDLILNYCLDYYDRNFNFFKVLDRLKEVSLIKRLVFNNEEQDLLGIFKRTIFTHDIEILKGVMRENEAFPQERNTVERKLRRQKTKDFFEEKILLFLEKVREKKEKSSVEIRMLDYINSSFNYKNTDSNLYK